MNCKYCDFDNSSFVKGPGLFKCAKCKAFITFPALNVLQKDKKVVQVIKPSEELENLADVEPVHKKNKTTNNPVLQETIIPMNDVVDAAEIVIKMKDDNKIKHRRSKKKKIIESVAVSKNGFDYNDFLTGYKSVLNNLCSKTLELPALSQLNANQMDLLVKKSACILHHCQLLWNGTMDKFDIQKGTIQLPKDCSIRVYAVIFYIIFLNLQLLVRVNIGNLVKSFAAILKGDKTIPAIMTTIYSFISMIQEYHLGGSFYKELENRLKNDHSSSSEESKDGEYNPMPNIVLMYENWLESFFFIYNEYSYASKHITDLYRTCMSSVALEGKSPRIVQIVTIYFELKFKEHILNIEPFDLVKSAYMDKISSNKSSELSSRVLPGEPKNVFIIRSYRSKRGERGIYFDINNLISSEDGKESCILFKRLMDFYMFDIEDNEKAKERRKVVFIKNIQKFIKAI